MKRWLVTLGVALILMSTSITSADSTTVLYQGKTITVEQTLSSPTDLWVSPDDLTRVNGFTLKPEGACLDDLCIPIKQDEDSDLFVKRTGMSWLNVTRLAQIVNQAYAHDADNNVWSFGPIPQNQSSFLESAIAPDFELKDRDGKTVRLSDYRGKKVMIHTWASW